MSKLLTYTYTSDDLVFVAHVIEPKEKADQFLVTCSLFRETQQMSFPLAFWGTSGNPYSHPSNQQVEKKELSLVESFEMLCPTIEMASGIYKAKVLEFRNRYRV